VVLGRNGATHGWAGSVNSWTVVLRPCHTGDVVDIFLSATETRYLLTTLAATYTIDKRRVVAAQTTRSRCKVLSIQYVYYFRAYQRQKTLHGVIGVGVIILYFAIFAAFKESMTLNLAQRSF